GAATVSDNCRTGLTATEPVGSAAGSCSAFSTTKSWSVTDDCGNTGTASQTVTYTRDTDVPVISLASSSSLSCNPTASQVAAAFGAATVSDNCSSGLTATGTVGSETGSGCTFSTTKSWSVTDACGNTGTASQTVTYTRDTDVPVISLASASSLSCNPDASQIAAAFGGATVSDNCYSEITRMSSVGGET